MEIRLESTPLHGCRVEDNTIISKANDNRSSHTLKVSLYRGFLELGEYALLCNLSLGALSERVRTSTKQARVRIMVEELGTGETYYSDQTYCRLNKDSEEEIGLQFKHEGHTKVSITLIIQGAIRGAHKIKINSAVLTVRGVKTGRKVTKQSYNSSFHFDPIKVPEQVLEASLTLKSVKLSKGLYSIYVLACGEGTISLDQEGKTLASLTLKSLHSECTAKFRTSSQKPIKINLNSAVGTIHLDRILINRHETSAWGEDCKIGAVIPAFNAEKNLREVSLKSRPPNTAPPYNLHCRRLLF